MAMPRERILEPFEERSVVDPAERSGVRWSGVFSGLLVGTGVVLLLAVLGVAIGLPALPDLSATSADDALRPGMGVGVWVALSLLIAFFVAGLVSTRAANHPVRAGATIQGMVVWVLGVLAILGLLVSGINAGATDTFRGLGLLGRAPMVSNPTAVTGGSTDEATRVLTELRERLASIRDDPARLATEVRTFFEQYPERPRPPMAEAAEAVQRRVRIGSWTVLCALLITLLVTIGGAALGTPNPDRW